MLVPKTICVQKDFGSKKFLSPKTFGSEKPVWVKEKYGSGNKHEITWLWGDRAWDLKVSRKFQ